MGLNDRDYARYDQQPGFHVGAPQSATVQIIAATVVAYLAQFAFPAVNELALEADWFRQPWKAYELLTYGFLHSTNDITHILLNMLVLFFFGRDLEYRYGRAEFLTLYLLSIVVAGVVWSLCEYSFGPAVMLGASGGVSAIFALYALNWPHRKVLFMFVIPMPMWVAALIAIGMDANGAMHRSGNVAFTAHLAGAAFGAAYYLGNWRLASWFAGAKNWLPNPSRPRLRVHEPDEAETSEDDLSRQVDAILEKIQQQGQDSLTRSERRILERASREYQQKRK